MQFAHTEKQQPAGDAAAVAEKRKVACGRRGADIAHSHCERDHVLAQTQTQICLIRIVKIAVGITIIEEQNPR